MKRGFTILELIVVILIIGILGTLGVRQYVRMVERARGAEARSILGQVRSTAAGFRLERNTLVGFGDPAAGIGTAADQIPFACIPSHYFMYAVSSSTSTGFVATATRCTSGGKAPDAPTPLTLTLTTDFPAGTDDWGGTGGY